MEYRALNWGMRLVEGTIYPAGTTYIDGVPIVKKANDDHAE